MKATAARRSTRVIAVATAKEEVEWAEGKLSELGAPPSGGRPSSTGRGRLTISLIPKLTPIAAGPSAAQAAQARRRGASAAASAAPATNQPAPLLPALPSSRAARSSAGACPRVRIARRIFRSRSTIGGGGYSLGRPGAARAPRPT